MRHQPLRERLRFYQPVNALEQENALQEIIQHHVLAALWRTGALREIIFHGGTCLRVLFGTRRFSEDLDFFTRSPDPAFTWNEYLSPLREQMEQEGYDTDVSLPEEKKTAVQKAFVRVDLGAVINDIQLPYPRHTRKKIRVKLEVDTNPPAGSTLETRYIYYPVTIPVTTQSLASGFGMKSAALLGRTYTKGRDWYDFTWYVARGVTPDLPLLANALHQHGPWKGTSPDVDRAWYLQTMETKILKIDWVDAAEDVRRFLPASDLATLDLWSAEYFLRHLEKLRETIEE